MMTNPSFRNLFPLMLMALITACGQKGDLYLPSPAELRRIAEEERLEAERERLEDEKEALEEQAEEEAEGKKEKEEEDDRDTGYLDDDSSGGSGEIEYIDGLPVYR